MTMCWKQMRIFLAVVVLLGCLANSSGGVCLGNELDEKVSAKNEKPNLLFIYLDDMGWRDTGFMGSDFYESPHLDRLANQGMIFTNAYAGASNCAPSRACLLTGQYSPRHKIYNVGTRPRGKAAFRRLEHIPGVDSLPSGQTTWATCLQKSGYRTASMGKWHLSSDPIPYGFHVNVGGTHAGSPPRGYYPPHGKAPGLGEAPKDEYLTDRLTEEAIEFIQENQSNPWALYLTHFAVHTPLHAKKELVEKFNNKPSGKLHNHVAMGTMIQAVDDGVGRIVEKLKELELDQNTIIVFTSDNGGYGPATDMAPLKGYKGCYYEGGIRVPMFVYWPGVVEPALKTDEPVTAVDLFPTFCEMLGTPIPDSHKLDGASLVPLLKQKSKTVAEKPRPLFWHFPAYLQSYGKINSEQRDPLFRSRPCSVIRKGDWKLHQYFEDNAVELYDLKNDIAEATDLSQSNRAKADELLAELKSWQTEIGADIPTEMNPAFDAKKEAAARKKMARSSK